MSIGFINASTNQGTLTYSITEQVPNDALHIIPTTGEISVLTEGLFDYEVNSAITGEVRVENGDVFETASIVINLNDVEEGVINHEPIYYFHQGSLKSLNFNDEGTITFNVESDSPLTGEIYSIAYDPSDSTFFGTTHYSLSFTNSSSFESYNLETNESVKKKVCDCRHHSATVNTKADKKILIKYGESAESVIFQEVNSNGEVVFESSEIDLARQVSNFIYIPTLDAYIAKEDNYDSLAIAVIDANSYSLQTISINIDSPSNEIYRVPTNGLVYDKKNDVIYYARTDGIYTIDINSGSAEPLETNWIEFFQSEYGSGEEMTLVESVYYPPTNELIIIGTSSFNASTGNTKFFAVDLETKQAREIEYSPRRALYRVYGFATKN